MVVTPVIDPVILELAVALEAVCDETDAEKDPVGIASSTTLVMNPLFVLSE